MFRRPSPRLAAEGEVSLAAALEQLPGALWTTDRDLVITQAAGRDFAAVGIDPASLVGVRVTDVPDVSQALDSAHAAALARGESSEYRLRHGGRTFDVRVVPLLGRSGEIAGTIASGIDVTERCALDEALRKREHEFHELAEHAPDVIVRFDRDLRHLYISPSVETVTGMPAEHFLGRTNSEIGMPDDLCELWERELGAVFELGEPRRFEFELETDGRRRSFEAHVVPERGASGAVDTILSYTRDRTEARRAELEKAASDARYRELFELAMDMIFLLDADGRYIDVNPAVEAALGYTREELIGQPLESVVAPDLIPYVRERLRYKLDGTEAASIYESVLVAKDGRRIPVESSSQVIVRDGVRVGVLAILRDITQQHEARQARELSERRFRSAFDDAAVGMVLVDPGYVIVQANAAFASMLGYRPDELVGMRVRDITHPDDVESIPEIAAMAEGRTERRVTEKRYVRKDGEIVWAHIGASAVRADDGTVEYYVGQAEDVTELRRAQQELEKSQTLHRVVVESSRDLLSVLDPDGRLRLTSRSIEDVLGYSEQELLGRQFRDLVHPDDLADAWAAVESALAGVASTAVTSRVRAKDGSYRMLEMSAAAGFDPDGLPAFVVTNSRDVTERLELEEQLRQVQKLEAVGRLAGGVAHDFNNVLLAIRGYGELALRDLQRREPGAAKDIEEMLLAARRAAGLTGQLLAFSRRQVTNPEVLDLGEVVCETVTLLRQVIGEHVELETVTPSHPVLVEADRAQIEQVVANLAVNARDAMPDGGRLAIEIATGGPETALLVVSDEGVGMDAATASRIFEPFFTTKGEYGTGLGLATVHGIVTQSGGEISVATAPGRGTTFRISLPLSGRPAETQHQASSAAPSGGSELILLVEDEETVRSSLARLLQELGYRVVAAESGAAALQALGGLDEPVDLVLSDVIMPGLNGIDTAARIRALQPQARLLLMSGYTDETVSRINDLPEGAGFIQKPFTVEQLAERVRHLLEAA